MLNTEKLFEKLVANGLPVLGVASNGRIDYAEGTTNQQKAQAEAIRDTFVPLKYRNEEVYDALDVDNLTIDAIGAVYVSNAPLKIQNAKEMKDIKFVALHTLIKVDEPLARAHVGKSLTTDAPLTDTQWATFKAQIEAAAGAALDRAHAVNKLRAAGDAFKSGNNL